MPLNQSTNFLLRKWCKNHFRDKKLRSYVILDLLGGQGFK